MTRWFANILIWLALTPEIEGQLFDGKWSTPLSIVSTALFRTVAHVMPWDVMVLVTLAFAWRSAPKKSVPAVARSIKLSIAALVVIWAWGVTQGASVYQTVFQLHPFVMGLFVAHLVTATCHTSAHVASLGKVVLSASLFRAGVCVLFYVLVARHLPKEEELTALVDHCDSVLFVTGLFILIVNALERRNLRSVLWLVLSSVLLIAAIVVNNRRIAWAGVGLAFVLLYFVLPKGKMKRRINWTLAVLSPILAAYVAAGWGNPTGIFKPVGSISTMVGQNQDASSVMRDIENYNLLRTLKSNPFLGYGWGREYIEEVAAFDISNVFPQYRYLPHNSLLGVIAFTGMFGFFGIWQVVVVAAFLHARVYRSTSATLPRIASLTCLVAILMIEVQMWGDIGFNHRMVCVMLAIVIGLSARLPILVDVWLPAPQKVAPPASALAPG